MSPSLDIIPTGVIEVVIDHTGPQGLPGVGGEDVAAHIADSVNPHGVVLTQDRIITDQATITTLDLGDVQLAEVVLDFASASCYTMEASGGISVDVSSIAPGQRASLHILGGSSAPTVTFVGVDVWIGGAPVFFQNKLTVLTLFNDGVRTIGAFGVEG